MKFHDMYRSTFIRVFSILGGERSGEGGAREAFLPHVGHDTCCRADIERHANVHKTTVKSVSKDPVPV